nr:Ig-like domain-containing protein [Gemmatimonadota bacterium]
LEIYMPVLAHRGKWTGGNDLIVASQLHEDEVPTGYNLAGARVPLSLKEAPATPTISIVPVETNFTTELSAQAFRNENDNGGASIGTLRPAGACSTAKFGCPSRSVDPFPVTDGIYLTESHIIDAMEPWPKGMPELELHVHGPQTKENPKYGEDLACIGGDSQGMQFWDQNPNDWTASIGNGAPMVYSRAQFNAYQAKFPGEALHFIMWEDDNDWCKVVTDKDMKAYLIQAAGVAAGAGALVATKTGFSAATWVAAGVGFVVDIIKNAGNIIYGNDDTVGALIDLRSTSQASTYPTQTHLVMNGGTFNGTVKLEFVWASEANGRPFGFDLVPSTTSASLDQLGTQSLGATVLDQYGSVISGHPISWRSDNPSVARIDDDGVLQAVSAGNTTVRARACDPTCMDRAVNVAITGPVISGPTYGYEEYANLTATVANPQQSSYYYTWEYSPCSASDCGGVYYGAGSGTDDTSAQVYVSRNYFYVGVRVTVMTSPSGTVVGTRDWSINGAGEYDGSGCGGAITCSKGSTTGGLLAPAPVTAPKAVPSRGRQRKL